MISFIVLHYKNIEETLYCLERLKDIIKNENSSIIVVDNNTLTNDGKNKILKYTNDILLLDKNYGFAKANNKGIKYARRKYNPDFYCVMNNDAFIYQKDFIKIIYDTYKKYHFDMLGPKIASPTGESVNPFPVLKDKNSILAEKNKCEKLIKIYSSTVLTHLLTLYIKVKKLIIKPEKNENGISLIKNVALHGCAIIFSKKYIEKYNDGFYNQTFLFHEEEFLYQRVLKNNLISIYNPKLEIFHKEGSSIKHMTKTIRKSKLFREKERLRSLNLLLTEIQGGINYE